MIDSTFHSNVSMISSKIAQMYDEDIKEVSIDLSLIDTSNFNSYLEEMLIEFLDEDDYEVSSYLSEREFIIIQIGDSLFIINYVKGDELNIKKVNIDDNNDFNNHINSISKKVNKILTGVDNSVSIELENPHWDLCNTHKVCENLKIILGISDISCTNYRWYDNYEFIIKTGEDYIKIKYLKSSVINSENTMVYISK